jgi:hypothetical protein
VFCVAVRLIRGPDEGADIPSLQLRRSRPKQVRAPDQLQLIMALEIRKASISGAFKFERFLYLLLLERS